MTLEITDEAKDQLVEEGYDPEYGARPLRRTIQRRIEDPLADELLSGRYKAGDVVKVEKTEDQLVLA